MCQPSKICQKKGGECVYIDATKPISAVIINGKNLCQRPCSCVKVVENKDLNKDIIDIIDTLEAIFLTSTKIDI